MTISHRDARTFYNNFGIKQDVQPFEEKAITALLHYGDFYSAETILEFGCGTGKAARTLLKDYLPATATYLGIDASETMVAISAERMLPFQNRAQILQTAGPPTLPVANNSVDRLFSTYVLDLLHENDIHLFFSEAQRVLKAGGKLAVASLTHGNTIFGKAIEMLWMAGFTIRPKLVGGCRPIRLRPYLDSETKWVCDRNGTVTQLGFCSEILIATKQ